MQKLLICRRLLLPGHKYVGQKNFVYPFPPLKCKKCFYPHNNCHWPDVSIAFFWHWRDVSSILLALAKRQYSILLSLARRQYSILLALARRQYSIKLLKCYTDVWPVTIITRVEAFFAFLRGKGVTKRFMIYIFVISEQ